MKNQRHQVIWALAAPEQVVDDETRERPGLKQLSHLEEGEERHQPDRRRARASGRESHGVGDPARDRHSERDPRGAAREPRGHHDPGQAEHHALGDESRRQSGRQEHQPEHEPRAGHCHAHREQREDHEPGGSGEAAEDVRGRHEAGYDKGQSEEQHDDVVGQHVRDEQRHGRDDGGEGDQAAASQPFRQGQDPPFSSKIAIAAMVARGAHGRELARDPTQRGVARSRLPGAAVSARASAAR